MFSKKSIVTIIISLVLVLTFLPAMAETAQDWKLKGDDFFGKGKLDDAMKCYEKSVEIDPNYAAGVFKISFIYSEKGEYEKSVTYIDKALKLIESGKDTSGIHIGDVFAEKAYVLCGLGKYEEAIKYYDKAIESDPEWAYPVLSKGYTLMQMGEYEDAIICFDRVLELDPGNEDALYLKEEAEKALKSN